VSNAGLGNGNGGAGKVAGLRVVVAGATSDSGRAVCSALATAGAHVIAVGSNADRLATVDAHERFVVDLEDAAAVTALATNVLDVAGVIHLVGGWRIGQSDDDWDWLEARVLTTLRNTSRAFRDSLSAAPAGRFAIVSATAVDRPTWGNANYATLKSAAESWMRALASGWAKTGTAAAVSFVVSSLGESGTPVDVLAHAVVGLWESSATELNGTRILLTTN
jgi:3-oxoacyl-[acyl-carrier protein] reductase